MISSELDDDTEKEMCQPFMWDLLGNGTSAALLLLCAIITIKQLPSIRNLYDFSTTSMRSDSASSTSSERSDGASRLEREEYAMDMMIGVRRLSHVFVIVSVLNVAAVVPALLAMFAHNLYIVSAMRAYFGDACTEYYCATSSGMRRLDDGTTVTWGSDLTINFITFSVFVLCMSSYCVPYLC